MEQSYIAKIYSKALYNAVSDKKIALDQLGLVITFIKEDKLKNIIEDKTLSNDEKFVFFKKVFAGEVNDEIVNLLCLLITNKKIDIINQVYNQFEILLLDDQGIKSVEFYTAIELSAEQKNKFKNELSSLLNTKLNLKFLIDPSIIGGTILKFGDVVYDCSIKKKLLESFEQIAYH